MREYTIKMHKYRLRQMLKLGSPCNSCPAGRRWSLYTTGRIALWTNFWECCKICREFVDIYLSDSCPCNYYGSENAIEITLIKLHKH